MTLCTGIASFFAGSSNTAELYEGVATCKERKYTSGKILLILMPCKLFCWILNCGLLFTLVVKWEHMGTKDLSK